MFPPTEGPRLSKLVQTVLWLGRVFRLRLLTCPDYVAWAVWPNQPHKPDLRLDHFRADDPASARAAFIVAKAALMRQLSGIVSPEHVGAAQLQLRPAPPKPERWRDGDVSWRFGTKCAGVRACRAQSGRTGERL